MDEPPLLPGRSCAGCTMCCRILGIDELAKPQGAACVHCDPGKGCRIYDTRPPTCREFVCGWLTLPILDERWYPAKSKMVVFPSPEGNGLAVHVDPNRPNAWREEPFYSQIRTWAKVVEGKPFQILVCIRERVIAVMPDGEVDLGVFAPGDRIDFEEGFEDGRAVRRPVRLAAGG